MSKYYYIGCHVMWREVCHYISVSKNYYDIKFFDWGLHCYPDDLRTSLQDAIDSVTRDYDAILIGYGLCSNGISGIRSNKYRLVTVRGHDCITLMMGSKERYREYFDKNPGTYWYSPGWIEDHLEPGQERYEQLHRSYVETFGEENADYLMDIEQDWFRKYTNAAYIDLNIGDNERFKKYTRECADWLKWKYDELKGDPDLLINFLEGNWSDNSKYLIVEPGYIIKPTYDSSIIEAVKAEDLQQEGGS
jgi:hypothetical protein